MKRAERTRNAVPRRHRLIRVLTVGAVVSLALLPAYRGGGPSEAGEAGRPAGLRTDRAPADGQVTAHDGKFWIGSNQIKLRGMNVAHQIPTKADLDKLADWGFTMLRYQFHWGELELSPPVYEGGNWVHTWDTAYLNKVKDFINDAYLRGIYILVDNHGCGGCGYFNYPDYLYDAPYNSKGKNYPETEQGVLDAAADFWTDDLRQAHMKDMWSYVANQLKGQPGIIGYEVVNEPKHGTLLEVHSTTNLMLNVQLGIASKIRNADPARVIFFTTRAGFGPGVPVADFAPWAALGNVAFDVHDYFGGRWGDGLGGEVPEQENYQEIIQLLYNHILADEGTSPYIGTTQVQAEFMAQAMNALAPHGIPLFVGEGGTYSSDQGAAYYFGTMTGAANYLGLSWCVSAFQGSLGILNSDGSLKPYGQIVVDAANYEG